MAENVHVETRQEGNVIKFLIRPPGESTLRDSGLFIDTTNTSAAMLPALTESMKGTVAANWRGLVGPGQR